MRARSLAAVGLLGCLLLLPVAPPASGSGLPGGGLVERLPVRVEVDDLLPRAPMSPDDVLQVTGRLVNDGTVTVSDLELRLAVGGVLRSRSSLAAADERPPAARTRGPAVEPRARRLDPGRETTFDLRLPVGELRLTALGVYPLQLQVLGRQGDARRTDDVGQAATFLPWFPGGPPAPSRLAFLWPLVDVPARAPDDALLGEDALELLRPGTGAEAPGRLAALLSAARDGARGECDPSPPPLRDADGTAEPEVPEPDPAGPGTADPDVDLDPGTTCRADAVPLTFTVDPDLLETMVTLSREHAVLPGGTGDGEDGPRIEPGAPAAQSWLEDLRGALAGEAAAAGGPALPAADLIALPYADPDVVALTRQRSGLRDDVEQLRLLGTRTAAEITAAEPLDTVVHPPPGRLTSAALDAALGGGASAVVLEESALPPRRAALDRTPGARTELTSASAGRVTALVVEAGLSALLTATPDDPEWQGARLAEQRWIAETAMIAAERPGQSRTFLVAPPRRATVDPEVAAAVLRDAGRLPWLCAVPLADVVAGTERCESGAEPPPTGVPEVEDRGDLTSAPAGGARSAEPLTAAYVQEVAEVRALGAQLTDEVLVAGTDQAAAVEARFLRSRARAVSSAWRDRREAGRQMFRLLEDDVADHRDQVQILTSGRQLLTSDTGVIDVSISNALDQPVTVGVQLNDPVEARLTSTDTDVRTVGPAEVVPVRLRVEARTSGQFVVRATLLDRAGQPFGEPAELVVRSTGYGRLALGITGVAAGVLLVAAGVRIVRRALHRPPTGFEDDPA
jgi:hypothetical protein